MQWNRLLRWTTAGLALLVSACGGVESPSAASNKSDCTGVSCGRLKALAAGDPLPPRHHMLRSTEGPDTVDVFSDPSLGGSTERFGPGVFTMGGTGGPWDAFRVLRNDDLSSLKVGAGAVAWLCEAGAYVGADRSADLGRCQVFTGGTTPSLPAKGFDDTTSTVVVTTLGASGRPAIGLVAWSDNGFQGRSQAFGTGGFDYADILSGVGNDAISSLEVKPGYLALLCTNGIGHAQGLLNGYPEGANCRLFLEGRHPVMPAGYNDVVTFIGVLPVSTNPALVGAFGPVKSWPYAAISQYLLADGRVMLNESTPDDGNPSTPEYMIWNPANDSVVTESTFAPGTDLFCSAFVHLPNGDLFATATGGGGNTTNVTMRYDSASGRWELAPQMIWKRYYPTASLTPAGSVLVTGGNDVFGAAYGQGNIAIKRPEIFENWAWRDLPGAEIPFSNLRGATNDSSYWPWVQAAANGRMFVAGPDVGMHYIDTAGVGSITSLGSRDELVRTYGSYAMYAPGKLLVAGGGPSVATASVISFDGVAASVATVGPLNVGRRQHNLTILSNGEVLANGGNSDGAETYSAAAIEYRAEIWSPATRNWRMAADAVVSRQYHSTAMLIPDGRVVVAGQCGGPPCERNAELYSPPYLFAADGSPAVRPVITGVKDQWRYAETIAVDHRSSGLQSAHLIKLGAVTHATNFEQRLVPLAIVANVGSRLQVTAPANANLAPPGHYLLIVVDGQGVPSVAKIVQVTHNIAPLGTASQSSSYAASMGADAALDGSTATFSHTAVGTTTSNWSLQWTRDHAIEQIVLHNRPGFGQRLRDIRVTIFNAAGQAVYVTPLQNPQNALKSPTRLDIDLHRLGQGAVTGRRILVERLPDPTLAGGPGDNDGGIASLTLTEVQVFAKP